MNKVSQQLREARESKGIELKQVEEVTNICSKYLNALEKENYCVFPGEVYMMSFLRSYARFLGLDTDRIVSAFREEIKATKVENTSDIPSQEANRRRHQYPSLMTKILHYIGKAIKTLFKSSHFRT